MVSDKSNGIETIAHRLGISHTKLLAQGILLLLMVVIGGQYFLHSLPLSHLLAIQLSLLLSIICVEQIKEHTPDWWYYLVIDGMMLLQFALVWLFGLAEGIF